MLGSRYHTYLPSHLCWVLGFLLTCSAWAQEANILGLPAVPQPKPGQAAPVAKPSASSKSPTESTIDRDVLAGEMGIQHSALDGSGRIVLTTKTLFSTAGTRENAIAAAQTVQRDLAKACGKQCKPEKMPPPKILATGQLEFALIFRPLHQHLSQAQFLAALQSKPLNLTPAQLTPPAAPTVSSSADTAPTTKTSAP
jgi:hypothetical protein